MKPFGRVARWAVVSVACATGCHRATAGSTAPSQPLTHQLHRGEIKRTLVASQPATGLPGWETRLYLIEYGPRAVAPIHVHPVVGVGRVLEGTFVSAFGSDPVVEVHAGEAFIDPANVPHRLFRNESEDRPLRFLIAYTIHAGEPSFYPVRVAATGVSN